MKDLFYLDSKRALLIGIFFFLLPINLYTYLGFMTEQYFMAFFLLSIYFMHKYMNTNKKRYFAFMYLFIFFSILVRQIGLLFPFVLFLTYIYWKKYRYAGVHFVFFVALLAFYQVLFPRTEEMVDWSYSFEKILNPSYVYSFVYVSMLFVVSMLLPFFVTFINFDDFKFERKRVINFVALAVLFGFLLNHFYAPSYFSWEEFPYIGNVFGQNGFLPFMLQGERQLGGLLPKMFVYWEYAAKAVLAMFVSYIFVYRKLVVTFYSIYVLVYLAVLLGGRDFYDRYLLFLMPVGVLFILSVYCNLSSWRALAFVVFISMFFVLNYQFTMNFVLSNDKVWEVSNSLVSEGSASPSKIKTSKAWMNIHYDEEVSEFDYLVTYDPPSKFNDFEVYYKQLGEYDLNFLFSMYENNKLYLYEIL